MLILTRKKGQSIVIDDRIEIYISSIDGDQVKIGVNAPANIKIYRKELIEAVEKNNLEAITNTKDIEKLRKLVSFEEIN